MFICTTCTGIYCTLSRVLILQQHFCCFCVMHFIWSDDMIHPMNIRSTWVHHARCYEHVRFLSIPWFTMMNDLCQASPGTAGYISPRPITTASLRNIIVTLPLTFTPKIILLNDGKTERNQRLCRVCCIYYILPEAKINLILTISRWSFEIGSPGVPPLGSLLSQKMHLVMLDPMVTINKYLPLVEYEYLWFYWQTEW